MKKQGICQHEIFERIFRKHSAALRNYLYYKCGELERSEDIVQECFKALWENCHKLNEEKAKSWLFTVATNKLYNEKNKDKVKLNFLQQNNQQSDFETPQFKLEYEEYSERLNKAISNLPDGQREAFLMNRIDHMTYKEIAEYLNISAKAVEKRISQALKKLNKEIFHNK